MNALARRRLIIRAVKDIFPSFNENTLMNVALTIFFK